MEGLAQRLAADTLELVSIPSVTGAEEALCVHLEAVLERRCPVVRLERVGHTLVALGPIRPELPTIGLFGHTDTVLPAADQPICIQDGRVYGCGASDMKGALAVMLALLEDAWRFTRANLVAVFYDKEEGPYTESGMIPLLASGVLPSLDLALCLEPTDLHVQAGCVGGLHARVEVHGRRAHSARPWQGDNAISRAIPLLSRVAAYPRREVVIDGLSFFEVLSVTQAHTENSRNVIPDRLILNLNYRYAPGRHSEDARAELITVLEGPNPAVELPEGLSIRIVDDAPAGAVCSNHPLLLDWRLSRDLTLSSKQAWTDVAQLTLAGIPAVNFGPGLTAQAHQAREYVPIELLEASYHHLCALFGLPQS